jgi:anti-anti-sigma factor
MNLAEQQEGDVMVLRPIGAITGSDSGRLGSRLEDLLERFPGRFVVDMAKVTLLDSRALEVLVEATEKLIRSGKALILVGPTDIVCEVLEITEVASLFEQFDDLGAAVGSLA